MRHLETRIGKCDSTAHAPASDSSASRSQFSPTETRRDQPLYCPSTHRHRPKKSALHSLFVSVATHMPDSESLVDLQSRSSCGKSYHDGFFYSNVSQLEGSSAAGPESHCVPRRFIFLAQNLLPLPPFNSHLFQELLIFISLALLLKIPRIALLKFKKSPRQRHVRTLDKRSFQFL